MELVIIGLILAAATFFMVKKLFFKKKNCDKCMWNDTSDAK